LSYSYKLIDYEVTLIIFSVVFVGQHLVGNNKDVMFWIGYLLAMMYYH